MARSFAPPFDGAKYLDSEETIAARLGAALDVDNPDLFLVVSGSVW